MSLDKRFKSTIIELPKKEGGYWCIIPGEMNLHYCQFKDGFFKKLKILNTLVSLQDIEFYFGLKKSCMKNLNTMLNSISHNVLQLCDCYRENKPDTLIKK